MNAFLSITAMAFLAASGLAVAQSDQTGGQAQDMTTGVGNPTSIGSGITSDGTMEKLPEQKPVKSTAGSPPVALPGTTTMPKPGTPGAANADGTGTSSY